MAADVMLIYPGVEPTIDGKEVDWIFGDWLMQNEKVSLVVAAPVPTRDANLTVRNIGGSILDLTLNSPSNDQLSAYIPTGARYLFQDPSQVEVGRDDRGVYWRCGSSKTVSEDGTRARVTYRLGDDDAFVTATVEVFGDRSEDFAPYDGVRADNTFNYDTTDLFAYCEDRFFRHCVGFSIPASSQSPTWVKDRMSQLRYAPESTQETEGKLTWSVRLHPASSLLDLRGALAGGTARRIQVESEVLPPSRMEGVLRAELEFTSYADASLTGSLQTDDSGLAQLRLPAGKYSVTARAVGYDDQNCDFDLPEISAELVIALNNPGGFNAVVVDQAGSPIPAKATIYSVGGEAPNFGPDSARTMIKNCVYAVNGKMHCPLPKGSYEVYFSRGPEYNSVVKQIEIVDSGFVELDIVLPRVVDTRGWISAELHSHSSPSGDNTSDQYGRVENLLCEHIEFAPCTEHARISTYTTHLTAMGLEHLLATCSGMELTGSPLPMNHQNAFPLHRHPHTQNGGGPRTDPNPVVQIERLAMWDNGSEKVVQQNHPNIHQIFGDIDVDGIPDRGFPEMFQWMDVIEVHPLETIFADIGSNPPPVRDMRIPIFQWMQLLNQGIRIPGVVNTDAHYNHHGSGWLRNWFASRTDDPSEIDIHDMIHAAEDGHIIMSTGPFLSVVATRSEAGVGVIPGEEMKCGPNGTVQLYVKVQCPNWLDVNRVQIFVNGRPSPVLNRTRRTHADQFGGADDVVKFDGFFEISLKEDAHLIVATIGEGLSMQKVMGEKFGNQPPIAVSNPIFVDIDGDGFVANGDELEVPLPRVENNDAQ
ncbi:CehA/McbA family metallohydrolase [Planctomycetaceae bacterium SH139]